MKIAEGCNHPCTFCIIPQIRGRHRSRTVESVAAEARALAKEVAAVITNQSVHSLGLTEGKVAYAIVKASTILIGVD